MAIPRFGLYNGAAGGTSRTGSSRAYGSVPVLPTSPALQSNLTSILNSAIPGFSGLTNSATSIIGDAMSGRIPQDVQDQIQDAAANQAVRSGMPGSSRIAGSIGGNRVLRDIGLTSLQRQDKGVGDLIGFLQAYSGTAAPTPGQVQEQENARAQYASAPDPSAAAAEQERLYNKYANPAAGGRRIPGGGGGGIYEDDIPWWARGPEGQLAEQKMNNWNRRAFGFGGVGV